MSSQHALAIIMMIMSSPTAHLPTHRTRKFTGRLTVPFSFFPRLCCRSRRSISS